MGEDSGGNPLVRAILLVVVFIAAFAILKVVFQLALTLLAWILVGAAAVAVSGYVVKRLMGPGD